MSSHSACEQSRKAARRVGVVALLCLGPALFGPGCAGIKPSYVPTHYYTVTLGGVDLDIGDGIELTLMVARFEARERYDERIVTRRNPFEIEYAEYDRWVERPDTLVTTAVTDWLRDAGLFRRVASEERGPAYDLILRGQVLAFERSGDRAICTLDLSLYGGANGRDVLWSDTLSSETPLRGDSFPALAEGLSEGLGSILIQAIEQWKRLGLSQ